MSWGCQGRELPAFRIPCICLPWGPVARLWQDVLLVAVVYALCMACCLNLCERHNIVRQTAAPATCCSPLVGPQAKFLRLSKRNLAFKDEHIM